MQPKRLLFDIKARERTLEGARILKEAVGTTLGPRGNNVAIDRDYGPPLVIHDGVSVAQQVNLQDDWENMGAQIIKEAAQQTNLTAGDGTTTAIVLAHAIATEAHKLIVAGSNPMMLRKGIIKAVDLLVTELDKRAKPIKTNAERKQVATISAQDDEIGQLIVDALEKVGDDGVVTVEDTQANELSIEYKEGMHIDTGWVHPLFVNDTRRMEANIEKPLLLLLDMDLFDYGDLHKLLEKIIGQNKKMEIVIIANDIAGSALEGLALNKAKQNLPIIPIKTPGVGDIRPEYLKDIASITGATVITSDLFASLEDVEISDLGKADRVIATETSTVIVGGAGDPGERVEHIRERLKDPDLRPFDRERMQERLARLVSGIAVINVGGQTEAEAKEKKERVIDAISATRAGIAEGIVAGGETALLKARAVLLDHQGNQSEEAMGIRIVYEACAYPFNLLLENAGLEPGKFLTQAENDDTNGIDVNDGKAKDLIKAGVIDPVKVTKSALRNAASSAGTLMTTNVLITHKLEQKDDQHK